MSRQIEQVRRQIDHPIHLLVKEDLGGVSA
jgi:hypothetical protein